MKMVDEEFFADDDFWVDDLYDMDEVQLRREVEQYARLARRYPHPTTRNQMVYQYAFLRHREALRLLEVRSNG